MDPSKHQTIAYTIMYYIVDILFLLFLLFMYGQYLYKNRKQNKADIDIKVTEIEMKTSASTTNSITPNDPTNTSSH